MLLKNDLNRILIENAVRLNLKNFENDEKRCIRRLIDTGLSVSKKNSEKSTFDDIRALFADDDSKYYPATSNLFRNLSRDRLINFGVNLGYNCFNKGAKTIEHLEKTTGKTIPWIADMDVTLQNEAKYRTETFNKLLNHYSNFGINAYIIRFEQNIPEDTYLAILKTLEEFQYTNFMLILPDEVLSNKILLAMDKLNNIILVLNMDHSSYREMLEKAEAMQLINATLFKINDGFSDKIKESDLFVKVSKNLCPIVIFDVTKDISESEKNAFISGLSSLRANPPEPIFMMNLENDIQSINRSISGKEVSTHINVKG
ncbi:MAG: hypothetical protein K6C35_07895 [Eubacterium sp.]|nr:hypothetical protein [Eubacterium sp.]